MSSSAPKVKTSTRYYPKKTTGRVVKIEVSSAPGMKTKRKIASTGGAIPHHVATYKTKKKAQKHAHKSK